ncbi:MAG TPA: tetratricopeptide repeat protein [Chthoniobacterales bacterium]|nr:tetratricopeptide repeat protein [Chthoniobacterales bacterium]
MSPENDAQLEIGHVLFVDIVGFSKLLVDEQSAATQRLNQVVRGTEQFQIEDASGRLIRLPTGDGVVLAFFSGPEAPARCAMEISATLKEAPFAVRMGIHSGPIHKVRDVDGRTNLTGTGINIAQRVMDCGDAGHILLSRRAAEDLEQHSRWQSRLHDLGQVEVKHGVKIEIVSLQDGDIGNPALPQKLKSKREAAKASATKWIAAGVVALILISIAGWLAQRRTASPTANPITVPQKSLAILPFKPLSSQNRDEALENGMADTLIAKLSAVEHVVIPSLTSAQKYLEQEHDPVAAARLLHVHAVLDGTLQKVADRIRVTVRLIDAADGVALWSAQFDEKFNDVFTVEDTIAQKVADALALQLTGEDQKRITKRYTQNTEAYQLYLKGRFYWNKYTEDGYRKSIELYKQAADKDPNYALAYSGIADSYSLLGELGVIVAKDVFPQAKIYAEKALTLDEELASAHLSLGIVKLYYDWDFVGAENELRRAEELDSQNAQVYHFYGHCLELTKRPGQAIVETKHGLDLDPTNLVISSELGLAYYFARRFDDAIAQHRKTLEMDPNFVYASVSLAQDYDQSGRYEEALAELNRARPISRDWSWITAEMGYVEARMGKRSEAQKIIQELNDRATREYIDPGLIAYVYIGLNDTDQAIAWLERGYEERSGLMAWLQIEPHFDPLRADPRFISLVQRMGLDRQ